MSGHTNPPRIVQQRVRNRLAEQLSDFDVISYLPWGVDEFFEMMADIGLLYDNAGRYLTPEYDVFSNEEKLALSHVVDALNKASQDIGNSDVTAEAFLKTQWPMLIQRYAREAGDVIKKRGRFSETQEESEPSSVFV